MIPVTKTSSVSNSVTMASSIAWMSELVSEVVTGFVTWNVATMPVIDGRAVGMLVVGAGTGCLVGFEVTTAAQQRN